MSTAAQRAHLKRTYLIGFCLAIVLTLIPFAAVGSQALPLAGTFGLVAVCGVIQIFVHLRFFLGLSWRRTPRGRVWVLIFAAVVILIMCGGTLWIMTNLHFRMMPM